MHAHGREFKKWTQLSNQESDLVHPRSFMTVHPVLKQALRASECSRDLLGFPPLAPNVIFQSYILLFFLLQFKVYATTISQLFVRNEEV